MPLASKVERALRARAHALQPVVIVGSAGATPGVRDALDEALRDHELVKVRLADADRGEREALAADLAAGAGAELIQAIGRVVVLYRERPSGAQP